MAKPACSDEEFIKVWEELKSPTLVACRLGINVRNVQSRRDVIQTRHNIKLVTVNDMRVRGTSTLLDAEGKLKLQWVKEEKTKPDPEQWAGIVKDVFSDTERARVIPAPKESSERKVSPLALIGISLTIGAITGLFGIGGGFLAIPILILFYNVAPAKAAGTSLFIIAINTLTGFFAHFRHWDEVNWSIPLLVAFMALIISRLASRHSSNLSPATLKKAFAIFVFAIATFTLVDTWLIS